MKAIPPEYLSRMRTAADEIGAHLRDGVIPFWLARAEDRERGGFLTWHGANGESLGTSEKFLNTQCRLLWWFSHLAGGEPARPEFARIARSGFEFIRDRFWDPVHGGWHWKVRADGSRLDDGKVVYGQSFAIYAMAEYALASGSGEALELAGRTFDLLQIHCADTRFGGYLENLEPDWSLSAPGFEAGDRKSLDTHMHLMESFTVLFAASKRAVHRRKLIEVVDLIRERMVDPVTGCGRNQFDHAFNPIPAIAIRRTWNAERKGTAPAIPIDSTSYGHNTELAWLVRRALETAGAGLAPALPAMRRLLDHAVAHGVDWECGGIYRDGTAAGGAVVLDKEFWQNAEALVGFLDGFELFGERRHLDAFLNLWAFARDHFVAPCGEWRVLLDRRGTPLDANVGNDWKVSYHTGRALIECARRLGRLLPST